MTTDGTAMMSLLDQRLDALDRALLGLVSRGERISMVADIEKRLREKQEGDSAEFEVLAALPEVATTTATNRSRETTISARKRSRLALSSGILGIVAVSLMFLLPITYVVVASVAQVIGEVPAIALIGMNVAAIAGLGTLGGVMALAAIVRISRSNKQKRGMGWAITGLCTSPMPALVGLVAIVFFVLPMTMEYANQSSQPADFHVVSGPMPYSIPPLGPVDCSNGVCVPPPALDANSYAYAPPMPRVMPVASLPADTPVTGAKIASKPTAVSEVKADAVKAATTPEIKPVAVGDDGATKAEASVPPAPLPPVEAAAGSR